MGGRVQLIHWNAAEAETRSETLRSAGYDVDHRQLTPAVLRNLRRDPPSAVVIDLSRLPSQGRDLAVALRCSKPTRQVPLVFVGGEPAKVARFKREIPDAVFSEWSRVRGAVKRAIAHPPSDPHVPASVFAGYQKTPLLRKLGIKKNMVVALVGAPEGFDLKLGTLPQGVTLKHHSRGRRDLTIWFVKSRGVLASRIVRMGEFADGGGLWIAWPKQAGKMGGDLTQNLVHQFAVDAGLVEYKIAAIDESWAGMRFTRRRP